MPNKQYTILITRKHFFEVKVEAENETDALKQAEELYEDDAIGKEVDYEHICEIHYVEEQCRCGAFYDESRRALSRKDNTEICSNCASKEALDDYLKSKNAQKQ